MGDFSFQKTDRLRKRFEFLRLSRQGRKVANEAFLVAWQPSSSGRSRLGVTVTKKVGCAAVRSRIKRVTREVFRTRRHLLAPGYDINVIARGSAARMSKAQAARAVEELFVRIGNQGH
ncbi:MAG: ribonuclease P protein component [Proteobacteria bacterium]|nr:ribonuclease P protein component [Pseudomonadota bacterium]